MLKKLILNGKKIPVPIPLLTLPEAMAWIEAHLVRPGHTITRVQLNSVEIEVGSLGQIWPKMNLEDDVELRCKIDPPTEICIQTIDALRTLSSVLGRNLKPIAVMLWEHKGPRVPHEAKAVFEDMQLSLELFDHILVLLDQKVDATNSLALRRSLENIVQALRLAESQSDFRGLAKILLNQLEGTLDELTGELSSLQKTVVEIQAETQWERKKGRAPADRTLS